MGINHHAVARRAHVQEIAFTDMKHRAGTLHGDEKEARRFATLLADNHIFDHADRSTYIQQAVATLTNGVNAN